MTEQSIFLIIILFSGFIALIYAGFIIWTASVFKISKKHSQQNKFEPTVSLIIAFRNEENTILHLLDSLLIQNYPLDKMEIILVDDSSNDKSLEQCRLFNKKHPELNIKLLELDKEKPGAQGKKEALGIAYNFAKGDYILLTDADCFLPKNNIKTRVLAFNNKHTKMVCAAVLFEDKKNIFTQAQALESLSLIATTAATTAAMLPILSNGANLAFERQAFLELPRNAMLNEEDSGDDVFLLHSFKKQFGAKSITFEFDPDAAVFTSAQADLKAFINQRIRWVSKSKSYKDAWTIMISFWVLSMNLTLVVLACASIFYSAFIAALVILFALKFIVDFLLLSIAAHWYQQKKLLWVYPVLQLFYPIFIVCSALIGPFLNYKWKGRKN